MAPVCLSTVFSPDLLRIISPPNKRRRRRRRRRRSRGKERRVVARGAGLSSTPRAAGDLRTPS